MHPTRRWPLALGVLVIVFLVQETVCNMYGDQQLYPYIVGSLEECMEMKAHTTMPDDAGPMCNRSYDTILCWVEVPVNTTTRQPCPTVYEDNPGTVPVFAYKFCEPNGTYDPWTNYSSCWNHEVPSSEKPQYLQYLQIVYSIGYSLSLLTLSIAMGIFLYFKKLRCPRNTIHMHLFMSFILRAVFMFVRDIIQTVSFSVDLSNSIGHIKFESPLNGSSTVEDTPCNQALTIIISICQYALVSNYYWLLVEGVYLHALITLAVFSESSSLKLYIALGWGVPILFVLPWVIVQEYTNVGGCWFSTMTGKNIYWIIKAPVMCSVVINFILFLNILRVLATKLNATNAAEARRYSKLAKSTLVLIPLFGVYYIVTIGMYATDDPIVVKMRMYIELGLSSFQGFLVAVLYCFMNGEVRAEIRRKWRVRQLNRTLSTHRSLRNGHSRSSFSTPSRQDSLKEPLKYANTAEKNSIKAKLRALKRQAFGPYHNLNGHMGNGNMARPSQTAVSEIDNDSDSNEQARVVAEVRPVRHAAAFSAHCEPNENTMVNAQNPQYPHLYRLPENTPTVIIEEVQDSDGYEGDIYCPHDVENNEIEVEIDNGETGSCSNTIDAEGEDRRAYPNIETEV